MQRISINENNKNKKRKGIMREKVNKIELRQE